MAAELLAVISQEDRIVATIRYAGATYQTVETLRIDGLTAATFKARVIARDQELAASGLFVRALVLGPIDLTPDPVVVPPPPITDPARDAYAALVLKRQRALAQGRPQAELDAIQTALNTAFRPEYLG